nr:PREDICTED: nuclear factor 7, brain-like [Lepisosteus oculatus]
MGKTIKDHILDSLEDLEEKRLKRFKDKLIDKGRGGKFPRSEITLCDPIDLATRLVAVCGEHGAVELAIQILREIHENYLALNLEKLAQCEPRRPEGQQCTSFITASVLPFGQTGWKKNADLKPLDVTLDAETAHPHLVLYNGGKKVRHGDTRQDLPDNPERFYCCVNVLGAEGFTSGRHYWEVEVGQKTSWTLGVARESSDRKGQITLCPEAGLWTVWLRGGTYTANSTVPVDLRLAQKPRKVGVYVDYEEGQVSFYNVEARSHMFTFYDTFREKLYPFFSPCTNEGERGGQELSPSDHLCYLFPPPTPPLVLSMLEPFQLLMIHLLHRHECTASICTCTSTRMNQQEMNNIRTMKHIIAAGFSFIMTEHIRTRNQR